MKITKDGIKVNSRIWYYLLDYCDSDNRNTIFELYGVDTIRDLTLKQILNFLYVATQQDIEKLH